MKANPRKHQGQKERKNYAMKPTFDIPFGSSNTSAKRTSPAAAQLSVSKQILLILEFLTLSHKILQVMPLDVIRKVSNIDPTVLL